MFLQSTGEVVEFIRRGIRDFAESCQKGFVSLSGGVDSTVVVTLLCEVFEPKNVLALYRDVRSNPKHLKDVITLQKVLGFRLDILNCNEMYDDGLEQLKKQTLARGEYWHDEGTKGAKKNGWDNAYASLKSRMTTPWAGFLSKANDNGKGRIYGTGNLVEDVIWRYYDKGGDGMVDFNPLVGLTKIEVWKLALWFAEKYQANIFKNIAHKIPSADLQANGDEHSDEGEITNWAKSMGFVIKQLSYGDLGTMTEGNMSWVILQDLDFGIVTGKKRYYNEQGLRQEFGYNNEQIQVVLFARAIEGATRHKEFGIKGITRRMLRAENLVD